MKAKKFARVLICLALTFMLIAVCSSLALASEATTAAPAADNNKGFAYLAAALSTGLAAIGAGIAVGSGAPAAIGALTEDPKSFGKALIFVALGEGIALYGMLISVLILFS